MILNGERMFQIDLCATSSFRLSVVKFHQSKILFQ